MKPEELSNLDRIALEKALKETPGLRVNCDVPKSLNKGFSDLPLFCKMKRQTSLFGKTKKGGSRGGD